MSVSRRRFLQVAALAAAVAPLGACTHRGRVNTIGRASFPQPLPILPLATSHRDGQGRRVFDLTAGTGQREFVAGRSTATWGYNGNFLGPTLRVTRGDQVTVNVHNGLPETTSVHWHGMHLPAAADGGPHQPIDPGQSWSPSWLIDQPAATLWYHPHPHGRTEKHVYRGLGGLFLIDDDHSTALDLPDNYGVDDIPLVVQDKRFRDDGSLDESDHRPTGLLGDTLLVNGVITPHFNVTTQLLRLRLLNGSTARIYNFGFSDNRQFDLIATDGGLLARPHRTDRIQLSPAERAEIVVPMQAAERIILRSYQPELGTPPDMTSEVGGLDSFEMLELRSMSALKHSRPLPAVLADPPNLDPTHATTMRSFQLLGRRINGKKMDMGRVDEVVTANATEMWHVVNQHVLPHNFHVHGVQYRVMSVNDAPPPPHLGGWKDTIYLPPGVPIELIIRFGSYADRSMPYMYHCHLLFHEDGGMMGQYVVVNPGEQPALGGAGGHQHH